MTDRARYAVSGARGVVVAIGLVVALPRTAHGAPLTQDTAQGRAVYQKWCAGCHGDQGAGDGEAARYMLPRPRDFRGAIYQIRTTASGELPTDADIMHAIDEGLPGTAMPGWKDRLSGGDRRALVAYLKTFSTFFQDTTIRPTPIDFSSAPGGAGSEDALRVGRQFYDSIGCRKCHGDQGRGDGPSSPTLKDDADMPIFAADLSEGWRFNGGASAADIYRRLRTGLDGTPMPTFSDLLEQQFLTDEQLWRVAQYVRSLSPERTPEVRDVIRAPRLDGALPRAPDDSAWNDVDRYWFPLVGQIIVKNRWFNPAVSGVWVQVAHTGDSLAMRVVWNDRSQSPDTAWLAHAGRVLGALALDEGEARPGLWPDQLVVQFPMTIPSGMERPYFLMGDRSDPVYQWRWSSASRGSATAGQARGIDRFDPVGSDAGPGARAVYDAGQWRVVFTRALATPDSSSQLQFQTGRAIPVAFFAWDGSNAETGTRMAVSTWYFLALDEPVPARVFISPVLAMTLVLAVGLLLVRRAQRASGRRQ